MRRLALWLMALAAMALASGPARGAVTVVLDDFEDLATNPWGHGAGMKMEAGEAHSGKAGAKVTLRGSGESLGLLRPYDVPAKMTTLKLWVKGQPSAPFNLQPVFKDAQGFCWYGGGFGVAHEGWKEQSVNVEPAKLQADWRLGWWKNGNEPKGSTFKFEMTFPLRFVGFKINGPRDKSATVEFDDLSIVAEQAEPYVHLPRSVVLAPQKGSFPLTVAAGDAAVSGEITLKVVSRNDVPVEDLSANASVNAPANKSQTVQTSLTFPKTGIYKVEITGAGISGTIEKQVQVISSLRGVEGFAAMERPAKAFTTDIKLSPKQTHRKVWESDTEERMYMYASELSPAWLMKNNATDKYTLFSGLAQWGLGAPSFMAIPANAGSRIIDNGTPVAPAVLDGMNRSWILVWFAGAAGFTDWDAPYLVVLEHKPKAIALSKDGLSIDFAGKAGYLAVLPLYGGYKPPQAGKLQFVSAGLAPKDVLPHTWARGLPQDVVARCDWWARVMKAYPVNCDEQFSVDTNTDELIVKSSFEYITINDDWKTQPLKLAPIPYVLGMCIWENPRDKQPATRPADVQKFPVTFDGKVTDPMYPTCYGPYMGIENADAYTYRMHVLQYVNEVEDIRPPANPSGAARRAMDAMIDYASNAATSPFALKHHREPNLCWGIYNNTRWESSNLLYIDDPGVQLAAQITRQDFFANTMLYRGQYDEADVGVNRKFLFFSGPGFGFQGDAGKITMDSYYTAWLYGYATGDYQLIADKWEPIVSRLNCLPFTMNWAKVGRDAIAEGGDEAPPPMGMARIAYAVGDMDSYAYGCYLFARELTHHYVKTGVGGDFFRAFQPIHPLVNVDWAGSDRWPKAAPIPQRANVTNMFGEAAGWILGGPPDEKRMYDPSVWNVVAREGKKRYELPDVIPWGYYGSGQWVQKWSRFDAEDVFRFYYDNSRQQSRRELDTWQNVEFPGLPEKQYKNPGLPSPDRDPSRADGYPGTPWRLMQLRIDLLHETEAQIAKVYPAASWGPADQTFYQAVVRSTMPRKTVRLVAKGLVTPMQPGIQRDFVGSPCWDNPVQTPAGVVIKKNDQPTGQFNWPAPAYYMARPPKVPGGSVGMDSRWSFGYITPGKPKPAKVVQETCNWVTDVFVFE